MFPRCFSLGTPRGILVPQAPGEAHGCVYVVPKLAKAADAVPSDAANVRANQFEAQLSGRQIGILASLGIYQ